MLPNRAGSRPSLSAEPRCWVTFLVEIYSLLGREILSSVQPAAQLLEEIDEDARVTLDDSFSSFYANWESYLRR